MTTRHFRAADLEPLVLLVGAARGQARRAPGVELLTALSGLDGDVPTALGRLARDPNARLAVGCYEGAVAGFALARTLPVPDPRANDTERRSERTIAAGTSAVRTSAVGETVRVAVVALYVDPGFRGLGVGESLIEDLERWAARIGAAELDVVALPGSRETKALLESLGYKARAIVMHRSLGA